MAQILKGAPVVAAMNEANAARCAALKEKGIVSTLAVVRVGAREDDISYEKGIVTRCGKVGVEVRRLPRKRTWMASRTARWLVCSPICPSVIRPARRRPALRS